MNIQLTIHSTKDRPPLMDERLLISYDDGYVVSWRFIDVESVTYIESKKTKEILPNGYKITTKSLEYGTPKKGRTVCIRYMEDGYPDIKITCEHFRYIVLEDSLLENLANCKLETVYR